MSLGWLLLVQYGTASLALMAVRVVAGRRASHPSERSTVTLPAVAIGVVGLAGTVFLQYLAFALAPIVAANVLAYAWPLLAALWIAATLRTRRAAALAGLAVLGFGGVASPRSATPPRCCPHSCCWPPEHPPRPRPWLASVSCWPAASAFSSPTGAPSMQPTSTAAANTERHADKPRRAH